MTTLEPLSDDVFGAIAARRAVGRRCRRAAAATSSGVHWREGIVVTADHAVKRDSDIVADFARRPRGAGRTGGRDGSIDVAVLRFDGSGLRTADFAARGLAVGRLAIAIARSDDEGVAASLGVISALGGPWRTWQGGRVDRLISPDLNIYSGFSGGPLIDAAGGVIGMNTAGLSRRTALTCPSRRSNESSQAAQPWNGYARLSRVGMQQVRLPENCARTAGSSARVTP